MSSIGERLKQERERLGLTIPAFADAAGAKKNTVIDWQNNKSSPPAEKLAALSAHGLDVSYVLTGQTVEQRMAELESRLDAIKEFSRIAGVLTDDSLKRELIRDVLLGARWMKIEIVDAAIDRYMAVHAAQPSKGAKEKK